MFELKRNGIIYGGIVSKIKLPFNTINVKITSDYEVNGNCEFLELGYMPAVVKLNQGFLSSKLSVCGAALITMNEMGFDLSKKDGIKIAYSQREQINLKFNELMDENPSLFMSQEEIEYEKRIQQEKQKKREEIKKIEEKFGKKFAVSIYNKELKAGMSPDMVIEIEGNPKFIDGNKWLYGGPFNKKITFTDNNRLKQSQKIKGYWKGMPTSLVIKSLGPPKKKKDKVFKTITKSTWYYQKRKTRMGTFTYDLELLIEEGKVVGFKEN